MEEFVPVNINTLDDISQFELYVKRSSEEGERYVLFKKENMPLQKDLVNDTFYIQQPHQHKYMEYLENNLDNILLRHRDQPQMQSKIIYNVMENVVQDIFCNPTCGESYAKSKELVDNVVHKVMQEDIAPYLVNLAAYNFQKYTHAVNCFMLLVHYGKSQKYDEDKLKVLGLGALLHDIGETQTNPSILKKGGTLNEEEREEIRRHPTLGFQMLQKCCNYDPLVRFMAWEHHERWDGSGYPKGIANEQITKFARLLSIVDVYSALTTNRPHRPAYTAYNALRTMIESKGFNPHELHAFISFIGVANIHCG